MDQFCGPIIAQIFPKMQGLAYKIFRIFRGYRNTSGPPLRERRHSSSGPPNVVRKCRRPCLNQPKRRQPQNVQCLERMLQPAGLQCGNAADADDDDDNADKWETDDWDDWQRAPADSEQPPGPSYSYKHTRVASLTYRSSDSIDVTLRLIVNWMTNVTIAVCVSVPRTKRCRYF